MEYVSQIIEKIAKGEMVKWKWALVMTGVHKSLVLKVFSSRISKPEVLLDCHPHFTFSREGRMVRNGRMVIL